MHEDFAGWHRSAGIEPDSEKLPKWWKAIEDFAAGREEIVSLTCLFYDVGKPGEGVLKEFRAALQNADPGFPMHGNDRHLAVLAGAELVDIIERGTRNHADLSALSLVCTAAQNLRKSPPVPEIPELAAGYLDKPANERTPPALKSGQVDIIDLLKKAGPPHDVLAPEFQKVQSELAVVAEEANILWWLISEHSRDLKQPWSKEKASAMCLIAGKELADLTRVIPGPLAALAFLDRVVKSGRTKRPSACSVVYAVNEAPLAWRGKVLKVDYPSELEALLPIRYAIKLSLSSPDRNVWPPLFEKASGISSDAAKELYILAYQMYLEALLCRAFDLAK
jgi:hypothetical protein